MIPGVILENLPNSHEDGRCRLMTVFNMDMDINAPELVKVAVVKTDSAMCGHKHDYAELFTVLEGRADFLLADPKTGATAERTVLPGKRLLIPAGVSHEARVKAGTILVSLTEKRFVMHEGDGRTSCAGPKGE